MKIINWIQKKNIFTSNVFLFILIAVITFFVYSGSLFNDFVFDDISILKDNVFIKDIRNIKDLFNPEAYLTKYSEFSYRPIATLSYFINAFIWKSNPLGFHLSNILLHILNVFLVFIIANKFFKNKLFSFIAAMIFALHPAISETVFCATYNEDLFCCFFYLLGFLIYIRNPKFGFILTSLMFFLALMSKEMALIFPVIIIAYELFFKLGEEKNIFKKIVNILKDKKFYCIGFILVIAVFIILRFKIFYQVSHIETKSMDNLFLRIIYIPYSIFQFVKITFFPVFLCADYSFTYPASFFDIENIIALIVFTGLIVLTVYTFFVKKIISFGITWFLLTLIPVVNIILIYNPVAERYLYLPSVGFAIALAGVFTLFDFDKENVLRKISISLKAVIILFILISFSIIVFLRAGDWKDQNCLWLSVEKVNPKSSLANNGLGLFYHERGEYDKAETYYKKAIQLNNKFADSYNNLACLYEVTGKNDFAVKYYKLAIESDPVSMISYLNLASLYSRLGKLDESLIYYKKALEINPNSDLVLFELGVFYDKKKMIDDAVYFYKKTIEVNPFNFKAYNNLGIIYAKLGKLDEAINVWNTGLKYSPEDNKILKNKIRD